MALIPIPTVTTQNILIGGIWDSYGHVQTCFIQGSVLLFFYGSRHSPDIVVNPTTSSRDSVRIFRKA